MESQRVLSYRGWASPAAPPPAYLPSPICCIPTPPQWRVLPGASVQQPYLVDHHASFEDGHEVRWLLAHRDPDLDRFIIVLLVQVDSLIGRGCDFILAGLATLGMSRMEGVGWSQPPILALSLASVMTPSPILIWTQTQLSSPPNPTPDTAKTPPELDLSLIPAPHQILSQPQPSPDPPATQP